MRHNVLVCLGGILLRSMGCVYDISSPFNDRDYMFRRYAKEWFLIVG